MLRTDPGSLPIVRYSNHRHRTRWIVETRFAEECIWVSIKSKLDNKKLLDVVLLAVSSAVPSQKGKATSDGPHDGYGSLDGAGLLSAACDLDDASGG